MYDFSKAIESIFRYKLFKEVTSTVTVVDKSGLVLVKFENSGIKLDQAGNYYYYKPLNSDGIIESKSLVHILNGHNITRIDCKGEDHELEYKITID